MDYIKDWDEYFMRMCYLIAQKSIDPKTKIGSVLTRSKNIISTGYNSFPRKVLDLPERYNNRELKRKMVSHSEENTILTSARLGVNTSGTTLYTLSYPCHICCKALIQGSVERVVIHKQWPGFNHTKEWVESIDLAKIMFKEAGIEVIRYDKILSLEGFLDGNIIKV